jgi:hypothetical protein
VTYDIDEICGRQYEAIGGKRGTDKSGMAGSIVVGELGYDGWGLPRLDPSLNGLSVLQKCDFKARSHTARLELNNALYWPF